MSYTSKELVISFNVTIPTCHTLIKVPLEPGVVAHTYNLTTNCSRRSIVYSENLPQKEREGAGKKSQLVKFLPHKYESQSWIPRNLTKSQVGMQSLIIPAHKNCRSLEQAGQTDQNKEVQVQ